MFPIKKYSQGKESCPICGKCKCQSYGNCSGGKNEKRYINKLIRNYIKKELNKEKKYEFE